MPSHHPDLGNLSLQPRRPEVLQEVGKHLAELTRTTVIPTDAAERSTATAVQVAMVNLLQSERARRPHLGSALTPARAARLLHALDQTEVRDVCARWRDDTAWRLWSDLLGYAPPGHVAPVSTLIALLAAQRGENAVARIALDHALADDPDYVLALLLQHVLDFGTPPDVLTALIDELSGHPGM